MGCKNRELTPLSPTAMTRTEEDSAGGQGARRVWDAHDPLVHPMTPFRKHGLERRVEVGVRGGPSRKQFCPWSIVSRREAPYEVFKVIVDTPPVKGAG